MSSKFDERRTYKRNAYRRLPQSFPSFFLLFSIAIMSLSLCFILLNVSNNGFRKSFAIFPSSYFQCRVSLPSAFWTIELWFYYEIAYRQIENTVNNEAQRQRAPRKRRAKRKMERKKEANNKSIFEMWYVISLLRLLFIQYSICKRRMNNINKHLLFFEFNCEYTRLLN